MGARFHGADERDSEVFADVLSYLRLYALALAGMIMADTFNNIGLGIPLVGGVFVIVIGHLNTIITLGHGRSDSAAFVLISSNGIITPSRGGGPPVPPFEVTNLQMRKRRWITI